MHLRNIKFNILNESHAYSLKMLRNKSVYTFFFEIPHSFSWKKVDVHL